MATTRQVRLLLKQQDGTLRRAAKLSFVRDGSVYLVPYARRGEFFYGARSFAAGQTDDSFNFREQIKSTEQPKLSIHANGRVHIYANERPRAGPVQISPRTDLRGEYIATVHFNAIDDLAEYNRKLRMEGETIDRYFGVGPDVTSGALLVYANGVANSFNASEVQIGFQVEREGQPPIYIGVTAVVKDQLGEAEGGVIVLAGFNPRPEPDEADRFLYLRGL